jgi:epoxyqueuosine reductase
LIAPSSYKSFIQHQSTALGFQYCGFAKAAPLEEDAYRLEKWLQNEMQGTMSYMEKYFDLRIDPTKLVPDAKTVITLMMNYYPAVKQNQEAPKISKYAYGNDYHEVIKGKLNKLLEVIKENIGDINGRGFVDSAPVLERSWALKSGLGWIGKNGNLITKQNGSFFFIATLITDLDIDPDSPFAKDYCGTCTACIDQCPTEAILPNKVIDGSKCISYFTIELKEALIPDQLKNKFDGWMFGCDTCQDVCPWNRFSQPHKEALFNPIPEILNLSLSEWEMMSEERFKNIFKNSPLKRSKHKGIQRNIKFIRE